MLRGGIFSAVLAGLLTLAQWAVALHEADGHDAHAPSGCEVCLSAVAGPIDAPGEPAVLEPPLTHARIVLVAEPQDAPRAASPAAYASRAPPRV